jgi:hypothetical protein
MLRLNLTTGATTGAVFFFLNEYIATQPLGKFFSLVLVFGVIWFALSSAYRGLLAFIIVSILSAKENRQLSTLLSLEDVNFDVGYFTFFTTTVAGFNLYVWTLITLTVISLIRLIVNRHRVILGSSLNLFTALGLLTITLLIATILDIPSRSTIEYRYLISDFRPIIVFLMGLIITLDFKQELLRILSVEMFIGTMKFLVAALSMQVLMTLLNDLHQGELRFLFNTSPHIILPLFFTWILSSKYLGTSVGLYSLVGGFKIARGEMLNIGISVAMMAVFFRKLTFRMTSNEKLSILRATIIISILVLIVATFIFTWYPFLIDFIAFKFSFFVDLLSGGGDSSSVSMRITELQNIMSYYWNNMTAVVWGRGFGGAFSFSEFPAGRALEINDFSADQINSGLFYKPHHFINFILLKGGIIGLFLYSLFSYRFVSLGLKIIRLGSADERTLGYYLFFFSLYSLNMYWQPTLIVWSLFVYSYGELILRSIKNKHCNF